MSHIGFMQKLSRITFSVVLAKTAWFQTFPSTKVRDEIKFQNASKRQIKIIYFYVIKTPLYKVIAGDSQTHKISNLGLGHRLAQHEKYNFIFPNIHVLFCLLYKKIVLLPPQKQSSKL